MEHADRLLLPGRVPASAAARSWRRGEMSPTPGHPQLSHPDSHPNILKQVDEQAAKRQSELLDQLNTAIADYKMAVEGGGASGGTSASYSVVTLTSGQTLALGVGCEVMLRVGTATLAANTDPGLIDVSTGGTLNNGGALTANHLYMATIADRTVQATAATVKLLVRGEYTVS